MTVRRKNQSGASLIEVLVSMLIVAVGVLGLAALQARAMNAEFESYQRSQAILLANDMVERLRMNRTAMGSFKNITDPATGVSYLGTAGDDSYVVDCTSTQAGKDLCAWSLLLQGSAETNSGGSKIGAMAGARGCISYDPATEISGVVDSGLFTVSVVWQGTQETLASSTNCANGLYGSEARRRVVSMSFRLGRLS
ncbi:MAG: type IV pilus modification protein PilV [Rhodocyclaceae bacterium]|jgi:type IV pilus assembly protein PilV|nr:type IV pilus modification protein PilV [Rhodocyclaceae bacterium]